MSEPSAKDDTLNFSACTRSAVSSMIQSATIAFADRTTATTFRVQSLTELPNLLDLAELPRNRLTLVVMGGASRLSREDFDPVRRLCDGREARSINRTASS